MTYPATIPTHATMTDGVDYPQAEHFNYLYNNLYAVMNALDTNFGGTSPAQGELLYRSSAGEWTNKTVGAAPAAGLTYFLATGGSAADPSYKGVPAQFILFTAGSGIASTTNGATGATKTEMTTNKQNLNDWSFPNGSQKYIEAVHALPADYNGGTVTFQTFWTANSSSSNSVIWGLQGRAYADGDAIDASWGSAVEVTDANGTVAYTERISSVSAAVTLAGSPAAGQLVRWRFYRLGSGSDNLGVAALLECIIINYTRA